MRRNDHPDCSPRTQPSVIGSNDAVRSVNVKMELEGGDMLIFENKDLPGLPLFLGEQAIERWHAVDRGLLSQPSALCCGGLRYTLR